MGSPRLEVTSKVWPNPSIFQKKLSLRMNCTKIHRSLRGHIGNSSESPPHCSWMSPTCLIPVWLCFVSCFQIKFTCSSKKKPNGLLTIILHIVQSSCCVWMSQSWNGLQLVLVERGPLQEGKRCGFWWSVHWRLKLSVSCLYKPLPILVSLQKELSSLQSEPCATLQGTEPNVWGSEEQGMSGHEPQHLDEWKFTSCYPIFDGALVLDRTDVLTPTTPGKSTKARQ